MSKLNQSAFESNFCDRVADLALAHKSATYRPVFNIAKDVAEKMVAEPGLANVFKATGKQIFRNSSKSDFLTSLKNMMLTGYGQVREMHGIQDNYLGRAQELARNIQAERRAGNTESPVFEYLQKRRQDLVRQFKTDKDKGFLAMGAIAQPRMDALKIVPPALAAAGAAGSAGLWAGNEHNQQEMKEMMQNQTLMERLKYVMFPRQAIRNYLLGAENAEKQSSAGHIKQASMLSRLAGLAIKPIAWGAGKAVRYTPGAVNFVRNVASDAAGRLSQAGGAAAGRVGMGLVENPALRGQAAMKNLFSESANVYRSSAGRPTIPFTSAVAALKTAPTFKSRVYGAGIGLGALGAGATGVGAAMDPAYRHNLGQLWGGGNVLKALETPFYTMPKELYNTFGTSTGREMAGNAFGLPMSETGLNAQWHKPWLFGGPVSVPPESIAHTVAPKVAPAPIALKPVVQQGMPVSPVFSQFGNP